MTSTSLKLKFSRILLLQLVVLLCAVSANAMHRDSSRHEKGIWKQLGLTEKQEAQAKEIRQKFKKQLDPLEKDLKGKMETLRKLEKANPSDQAQINKAIEEMQAVRTRVLQIRAEMRLALRNILDEAQKKKLDELTDQKRAQGHGKGRRHHPRP